MTKTEELVKNMFEEQHKSILEVIYELIKMVEARELNKEVIQEALRANGVAAIVTHLAIYYDANIRYVPDVVLQEACERLRLSISSFPHVLF